MRRGVAIPDLEAEGRVFEGMKEFSKLRSGLDELAQRTSSTRLPW